MGIADVNFITYHDQGVYVHRAITTVCDIPVYAEIESHSPLITDEDKYSLMESIHQAVASFSKGSDTLQ